MMFDHQLQRLVLECQISIPIGPTGGPGTLPPGFTLPAPTLPSGIGKRESGDDDGGEEEYDEERRAFSGVRERLEDFDGVFEFGTSGISLLS